MTGPSVRTNPSVDADVADPALAGNKLRLFLAAGIACVGSFTVGLSGGYPSPAVPDMNAHRNPFHMNSDAQSWFSSVGYLGAIVGSLLSGALVDRLGRKLSLMVALVPYTLGWIAVGGAPIVPVAFVGRFLAGMSCPVIFIAVNIYVVEISPPAIRGILVSFNQLFLQLGIFTVYLIGSFVRWNWLTLVCAAPAILLVSFVAPLPETPRWLFMKKRTEAAVESMLWFRGTDGPELRTEIREIQESLRQSEEPTYGWWRDSFRKPLVKCFAISVASFIFQEFSGINVVRTYTVTIFQSTDGETVMSANAETVVVGATMVVSSILATFIIDRITRRILLIASFLTMAIGMAALGTFFSLLKTNPTLAVARLWWMPLASLAVFALAFSVGCGPLPHAITNELFPTRARARSYSLCIAADYAFGFLVIKCFPYLNSALGDYGTFWTFAAVCCVGAAFVYLCVPETMGRSLEELEQTFKAVVETENNPID